MMERIGSIGRRVVIVLLVGIRTGMRVVVMWRRVWLVRRLRLVDCCYWDKLRLRGITMLLVKAVAAAVSMILSLAISTLSLMFDLLPG